MKNRIFKTLLVMTIVSLLAGCGESAKANRPYADRHSARADEEDEDDDDDDEDEDEDDEENRNHVDRSQVNENFIVNYDYEMGESFVMDNVTEIVDILAEDAPDKNIIVSDTSLNMALGMLAEGAEGETLSCIEKYLTGSGYEADIDSIRERNNALINIYRSYDAVEINLADSAYVDIDRNFTEDFVSQVQKYYDASALSLDFADPESADVINSWCADMTNNKIPMIVSPDTLAMNKSILVNALYFNGDWEEPVEDRNVEEEDFNNYDGSTSTVQMMYDYDMGAFFESDGAIAFRKYYEGGDIVFVGILPKEEGDFTFEELDLDTLMSNAQFGYKVNIKMPEFIVEDMNYLTGPAMEMGLEGIFNDADLSNYCTVPQNVTDIIQKTYVDVNREGTEAAAVTAIMTNDACAADEYVPEIKEIYLDRPFAFLIYDITNMQCLFAGKIISLQ